MSAIEAGGPRRWFGGAGLATQLHLAVRRATLPTDALLGHLPTGGRVLDWGSGHGLLALLAAERDPRCSVHGVEVDAAKVALARRAAVRAGVDGRVTFATIEPDARPSGRWEGVLIVDVLYLLDAADQEELVRSAARATAPGGTLVVKETAVRPAWKHRLSALQEQVAVRALRLSRSVGGPQAVASPEQLVAWFGEEGMAATVHALDRGYHVPHVAVVGHRPST